MIGSVFQNRPEWAVGNFWAPEIAEYQGKFFIYYVGRKKGGPLSVAVATADRPEGPWTDHGPMVSQDAGSIDGVPFTNNDGKRYLIWKEDGNSRNLPTPLWIQELSPDGTKLVGEMKEILRNNVAWEGRVVEGPTVVKKGEYFYLFYAGNACCGRGCHYGEGVARAKDLLGPWEKYPNNPIIVDNELWKCPGHGTVVRDEKGDDYLMYHAYHADDFVYVGRQAVLDRIEWKEGWPVIAGRGVAYKAVAPGGIAARHDQYKFTDEFTGAKLDPEWQWPQHNKPRAVLRSSEGGILELRPNETRALDRVGGVLAIKTTSGNYEAMTVVRRGKLQQGTIAGLSAYGDHENALGLSLKDSNVSLWRRIRNKEEQLMSQTIVKSERLFIKLNATQGSRFRYSISTDGQKWTEIGEEVGLQGEFLPPWDRGIRVALTCGGGPDAAAEFESLQIDSKPPRLQP
jgi:xylan 1,4-beta-xylosidase